MCITVDWFDGFLGMGRVFSRSMLLCWVFCVGGLIGIGAGGLLKNCNGEYGYGD